MTGQELPPPTRRCSGTGTRSPGRAGSHGRRPRKRAMSRCWSSFSRRPRRSPASACSISAVGTGVTTVPYAAAVGPSGHVTGADIARPMLDAARRRVEEAGLNNVELLLADAQVHAFAPDSYDLLTSRLGVMFFADPRAAFRNLIRALRPSGRLVMAVWATIDENPHWKIPLDIAVRHLGPPAPQPPHAPGPHAFGDRDYLRGPRRRRFCRDRDRGAAVSRPRRYARGGGRARNSGQLPAAATRRKKSRRGGAAGDPARHRGGIRPLCGERRRAPAGNVPARHGAPAGSFLTIVKDRWPRG